MFFVWLGSVVLQAIEAKPLPAQFHERVATLEKSSASDLQLLRTMAEELTQTPWGIEKQNLLDLLEKNSFLLRLWTKFLNRDSHPFAISLFHRLTQSEGILPLLIKTLERSESIVDWIERIRLGTYPFLEKYALYYALSLHGVRPVLESVTHIPFCPHVAPLVSEKWMVGLVQPDGCLFLH